MKKLFKALGRAVVGHPKAVMLLSVLCVVGLGAGMSRLTMDADMTDDIPSTIPEKAFFDEVGKIFPANDVLVIAFSDSRGVYSPESLAQVADWTERIRTIEDVKSVLSLSNATMITGTENGIVIEPVMREVPADEAGSEEFRKRIENSGMADALVGRDGLASCMMISIDPAADTVRRPRVAIELPKGLSSDAIARIIDAVSALPEAAGDSPQFRIYSPESDADCFDAASLYAVELRNAGANERILARPGEGADLKKLAAAAAQAVKPFGAKAKASASQVSMYDRMNAAIALMPRTADGKVYVSGSKAVTSVVGKLMGKDLATLFPVVIVIIIVILFLSFRTMRGVVLPFVNVIMATVMAMGVMGWTGQSISMATMVLPIILIAVGTAYAIHVLNRYYEDIAALGDKKKAIVSTMEHVAVPILFAALTTMTGFASLAVSNIDALKVYGLLAALGILFALILAITFTPAMLALLAPPKTRAVVEGKTGKLERALEGLGKAVSGKPGLTLILSLAVVAIAAVGIPRIVFETNTVESFRKDSDIRRDSEYFNDNFTGITIMTVVVRAGEEGAILEPDVLKAMDSLEQSLAVLKFSGKTVLKPGDKGYESANDLVGGTQSIVTFVKGINKAFHGDEPAWEKTPDAFTEVPVVTERYELSGQTLLEIDSDWGDELQRWTAGESQEFRLDGRTALLVRDGMERRIDLETGKAVDLMPGRIYAGQLVFQYENSGDPEDIEAFIDNPRQTARINVFLRSGSSTVSRQVQNFARGEIARLFPEETKADITGLAALNLTIMDLLVSTQIWSMITSLAIIFLMIALKGRSIAEGVISILPLTASLVINFGIMGFAGIPVDISTATIASIAIGIGVDYTLHFMERYRIMRRTLDAKDAVVVTMRTTGKGIVFNAVAVAGGFLALAASSIRGNIYMGSLMAVIMVVASSFAMTMLPAILLLWKPKFLERADSPIESGDE